MLNEHPIREVILDVIRAKIENHPRSLQKAIGPSEIGHPCTRWMAYKLSDIPQIPRTRDKWRATVGTAVHTWLGDTFEEHSELVMSIIGEALWLVENRVNVGTVYAGDGYDVYGGCDLFAALYTMVLDWKIVGKTTMDTVRRKQTVDAQYRVQAHSYGRGWLRAGKTVTDIGVMFLPASGALDEALLWHEPFDESVAEEGLQRVTAVQTAVNLLGDKAPAMMPPTDHYCLQRCEWYKRASTNLSVGCPGVGIKEDKTHRLLG